MEELELVTESSRLVMLVDESHIKETDEEETLIEFASSMIFSVMVANSPVEVRNLTHHKRS